MLDAPPDASSEAQPPAGRAAPEQLHGRVLLAEDGPDNQRLIRLLLAKAGLEVDLAENGNVARDKALAENLAELAGRQQEAADQVLQAEAQPADQAPPAAPSPLAEALAEARRQLTQAQQATLQAAQQVAGQNRSANPSVEQAAALAAAMSESEQPDAASSSAPQGGGAAQQGRFEENRPTQPGPLRQADPPPEGTARTPDSPDQQAETRRRGYVEEPWVMRLPPEVRAAIRASVQRRAPRGYEERMERYFKNID
jgi:ElaB/YqjD/DUF883 family membrane-anchored ribosome-binding protein